MRRCRRRPGCWTSTIPKVQGDTLKLGVDRRGDGLHEVVRCALRAGTLAADILNGNDKADKQDGRTIILPKMARCHRIATCRTSCECEHAYCGNSRRLEWMHIPGAAPQTRVVCTAGIRLGSGKSARPFKGIICVDISEFESSHPSHAVRSLWAMAGLRNYAA
jgi:hypothetical protein